MTYVTLYHKTSRKVGLWPIWFYCKFRNFMFWALKRHIIWLHSTLWSKVMVVWFFQNVFISTDFTITFWCVSQNDFCQLYERLVIQGHISLTMFAQSFTHEKSISLENSFVFIDLWHVYWPISQKVFWWLTAGFVGVGHICTRQVPGHF